MRRAVPLGLLLALFALSPIFGQDSELEARRQTVKAAKSLRDGLVYEMAAAYKKVEADFDLVRSDRFEGLSRPLVTLIDQQLALLAADPDHDSTASLTAGFEEAELFSREVAGRLATAIAHRMPEVADASGLLEAAVADVFPAKSFADCWDEKFLDLQVVTAWKSANDDLRLAEEALAKLEEEASADPEKPRDMVLVPRGRFVFGPWVGLTSDLDRNEEDRESVNAFYIDVDEVTNEEFLEFLSSLRKARLVAEYMPATFLREGEDGAISFPEDAAKRPVCGVTYPAAKAFAEWKKKRLPTEEEWEKAARGENGLLFPWGEEFDGTAFNWEGTGLGRAADVGSYPRDSSPYGARDMSGNVSEITATLDGRRPAKRSLKASDRIVLRGANFTSPEAWASPRYRSFMTALTGTKPEVGFRCAISERDWKRRR